VREDHLAALAIAEEAARAAGRLLADIWRSGKVQVNRRERHDVKLAADVAAETAIMDILRRERPGDRIISEESGSTGGVAEGDAWIVDPLDGTVNFSHGHPHFCISIAWCRGGVPVAGAVFDPIRGEMFTGAQGVGAWLNGKPILVSKISALDQAMLAAGFGKVPQKRMLRQIDLLAMHVQKLRIGGSAALDLVYTACGRLDGYCESRVYVWDLAAAAIILREAGGTCRIQPAANPYQRECVASNGNLDEAIGGALGMDFSAFEERWTRP